MGKVLSGNIDESFGAGRAKREVRVGEIEALSTRCVEELRQLMTIVYHI
jgi:hypothetical protein